MLNFAEQTGSGGDGMVVPVASGRYKYYNPHNMAFGHLLLACHNKEVQCASIFNLSMMIEIMIDDETVPSSSRLLS